MSCSTEESSSIRTGRVIEARNTFQDTAVPSSSGSHAHFNDLSFVSFRRRAALRCKMGTLYVSRSNVKKKISQVMAMTALIQRIFRHPRVSAMAPLMAGPMAPPISGASMTRDIPEPRNSDGYISPMIAGLRTFEATANPVRKREKMNRPTVSVKAASKTPRMKMMFAALKTG